MVGECDGDEAPSVDCGVDYVGMCERIEEALIESAPSAERSHFPEVGEKGERDDGSAQNENRNFFFLS